MIALNCVNWEGGDLSLMGFSKMYLMCSVKSAIFELAKRSLIDFNTKSEYLPATKVKY